MKEKRVVLILTILFITLLIGFVIAADEPEIEKAYSCLKTNLGDNCGNTKNTDQAAFNLLAMADDSSVQSDCKTTLKDNEKGYCWGATSSSSCDIKSTALAILALNHIGANVDDSIGWLLEKREIVDDLDWYLEIDANNATECKIKVNDANAKTFTINENKKISGSSSCLSPAEDNYFLKIDNGCLNKNFTISCDKDFITTLFYKKQGEATYFISSETHFATSYDSTTEKVNSYCFATSNSCNYEGSLWASLALAKVGEESSFYIPYLSAMADKSENKKYLPSAFLYMLTNRDDYLTNLISQQQQGKFWEENNKLYDTALALLALQNTNVDEAETAKSYLFSIQESTGCWSSDTAFILYALSPKEPVSSEVTRSYCETYGYFCTAPADCSLASTLNNFYCVSLSDICCETKPIEQTCDEKGGLVCESNQQCTQPEIPAGDTNYCCKGSCQAVVENECENLGYSCEIQCSNNQEEKQSYSAYCNYGEICCAEKVSGSNFLLILLLIILIILVVLAIIFRNQLKVWLFRFKGGVKFKSSPKHNGRPSQPPGPAPIFQRPVHRVLPPNLRPRPPMRRPIPRPSEKDRDFDDTMKKLREMSK